jgi:hypothetical protein
MLEFGSGKLLFILEVMGLVLKVNSYEMEIRQNLISILLGFTRPDTYFDSGCRPPQEFAEKINLLLQFVTRMNYLQIVCDSLNNTIFTTTMMAPSIHTTIQNLMTFVSNVYHFGTVGATGFRQSVLVSTPVLENIIIPYILRCIDGITEAAASFNTTNTIAADAAIAVSVASSPPPHHIALLKTLQLSFSFLSLITFHMGSHCHRIRALNSFTHMLLQPPLRVILQTNITLFASLLRFNANLDSLAGEHAIETDIVNTISQCCTSSSLMMNLSQVLASMESAAIVQLHVLFIKSSSVPIAHDTTTYEMIVNLCLQSAENRRPTMDDDTMSAPLPPLDTSQLDAMTASLDNQLQVLEKGKEEIESIRASLRSATSAESCSSGKTTTNTTNKGSLLGALPPMKKISNNTTTSDNPLTTDEVLPITNNNLKLPPSIASPTLPSADMPTEFLCAINGHVMKNPMNSPYGHVFERETIEYWIYQSGSICPLTGKVLRKEDLVLNKPLQERILAWIIDDSMRAQQEQQTTDDDDIYSFK